MVHFFFSSLAQYITNSLSWIGIWDVANSRRVVNFVRERVSAKVPLDKICEQLCDLCLAPSTEMDGLGCDNMTVVIIALLQGKTKEEWYEEVGKRAREQGIQHWNASSSNDNILASKSSEYRSSTDSGETSPTADEASFLTPEYLKQMIQRGAAAVASGSINNNDDASSKESNSAIALPDEKEKHQKETAGEEMEDEPMS